LAHREIPHFKLTHTSDYAVLAAHATPGSAGHSEFRFHSGSVDLLATTSLNPLEIGKTCRSIMANAAAAGILIGDS
jgi:hypothetical protein